MKKLAFSTMACVLAVSLMAGSAYAKPDNTPSDSNKKDTKAETKLDNRAVTKAHATTEDSDAATTETTTATETDANKDSKDKEAKDRGHNGYKGLLNAIEHVKDKPAGAVIANLLLTKYESKLTAEQKAELEAISVTDSVYANQDLLSVAADELAQSGNVTDAVYVQKEAIHLNVKHLDSYKKLGQFYDKLGKTGVKLYVNGDEPEFEVAPFIREGSTLVPFRAISEALKADVSWNPDERSVTVARDGLSVKLFIGSTTAYVNGQEVTLEVPADIAEGSTVVPVRFISEALKASVNWEGESQSVIIVEQQADEEQAAPGIQQ